MWPLGTKLAITVYARVKHVREFPISALEFCPVKLSEGIFVEIFCAAAGAELRYSRLLNREK
jgi:hypothetical protein